MFHEPVFSIFMAACSVAISLLVWNLISGAGPREPQIALARIASTKAV
jgi:hypothetical protein